MKVESVEVEIHVEHKEKRIHVLELSPPSYNGLHNSIGPEFQKKLIEQANLLIDVLDFEWICYGAGGVILTYKDYGLQLGNGNPNALHWAFVKRIKR